MSSAGDSNEGSRSRRSKSNKSVKNKWIADESEREVSSTTGNNESDETINSPEKKPETLHLTPGTYWLTRIVLLRYIGFIYFIAFLVALHQNKQLFGSDGLLPADKILDNVKTRASNHYWTMFNNIPSIFWLFDYKTHLDILLDYTAYMGLFLSSILILHGAANWFIMFTLWMLYHSLVNIGQTWYSFGWESQLLETGFLAIFLCPVWNMSYIPKHTHTSRLTIWGYRWLIFRIMLGAGLIKIRGDKCWRDLTCMNYHYETQPVPNPMSYYMHQSPELFHKFETLSNHFVELIAPFFLILTRRLVMVGGAIQILFQAVLIISGNLSFLNWLTILPSLACYDDRSLSFMFSKSTKDKIRQIELERKVLKTKPRLV